MDGWMDGWVGGLVGRRIERERVNSITLILKPLFDLTGNEAGYKEKCLGAGSHHHIQSPFYF